MDFLLFEDLGTSSCLAGLFDGTYVTSGQWPDDEEWIAPDESPPNAFDLAKDRVKSQAFQRISKLTFTKSDDALQELKELLNYCRFPDAHMHQGSAFEICAHFRRKQKNNDIIPPWDLFVTFRMNSNYHYECEISFVNNHQSNPPRGFRSGVSRGFRKFFLRKKPDSESCEFVDVIDVELKSSIISPPRVIDLQKKYLIDYLSRPFNFVSISKVGEIECSTVCYGLSGEQWKCAEPSKES